MLFIELLLIQKMQVLLQMRLILSELQQSRQHFADILGLDDPLGFAASLYSPGITIDRLTAHQRQHLLALRLQVG